MGLTSRQREILSAICREYMLTGEAVGSRTLVKRQAIDQSPATVRNVMADLEDRGMVEKPHTSGGRKPTEEGLRFFIERLMQIKELSAGERQEIRSRFELSDAELSDLMREISRLLSDLSKQCALVVVPRSDSSTLKRIEFVPLRPGKLIAVLVMSSGMVQNRLVHIDETLGSDELLRVHNYLNELCTGKQLSQVRRMVKEELLRAQQEYDGFRARALQLGSTALSRPPEDELLIEGQSHLLGGRESQDAEKMKALLRTLEERETVLQLLDKTISGTGVRVFIGAETDRQELSGYAMVASAYGGTRPVGTVGVIGPTYMDYPRVLPLVDFAAGILTDLLRE